MTSRPVGQEGHCSLVVLQSILEIGKQEIADEISKSKCLAVLCDETTNVFDKSQIIVVFTVDTRKVVSRLKGFWDFFSPLV